MKMLFAIIVLAGWVAGCASHKQPAPLPPTTAPAPATQPLVYDAAPAAALVFQPPIAAGEPQLALSRQGRDTQAFMGFDQATTTYHYVRFDDRQSDDFRDGYLRRSVTVKVGVTQR